MAKRKKKRGKYDPTKAMFASSIYVVKAVRKAVEKKQANVEERLNLAHQ